MTQTKLTRKVISVIIVFIILIPILLTGNFMKEKSNDIHLFIGTYTNTGSKGIYLYKFNTTSDSLNFVNATEDVVNPSYLAVASSGNYLYAVNEINDFDTLKSGSVTAFEIDKETKSLSVLNRISSGGAHPCYISIDADSKFILTANYTGGNIASAAINNDGSLGEIIDAAHHSGSSIVSGRQDAPHAHFVTLDPQNKFVYAVDLGIDKVMIYKFENGKLIPNEPAFVALSPGAGPRHMVFHPTNNYAYVITELNNKIYAFKCDRLSGSLTEIKNYSTLPLDFDGVSYCADIHIHPNGKYLYGSNRGHNSIVIFSIEQDSGQLTLIGHESTRGDWPRNFTIDPSGKFLLVANQKSNNITVFRINQSSGELEFTGITETVPVPVCLKFLNN